MKQGITTNINIGRKTMKSIVLATGILILGICVYGTINVNLNDKNTEVYSYIHGTEQPREDGLNKYDSVYDFPMDEIAYPDVEAFTLLESAYQEVDFYGDFKPGDLKLYDNFKLDFERLLHNEVPFTRKSTGERMHLQEFDELTHHEVFDPRNISYCFFDMNEDGTPELCLGAGTESYSYIFKYNPDDDEFILIHELYPSYYQLNGSNKIRYEGVGGSGLHCLFYKYNGLNEEEYNVSFFMQPFYNDKIGESDVIYMAGLPHYTDKSKKVVIPQGLKSKAYLDEGYDTYYFRITEEQFDDLTEDYWEASRLASETIKNVSYSYDELFTK